MRRRAALQNCHQAPTALRARAASLEVSMHQHFWRGGVGCVEGFVVDSAVSLSAWGGGSGARRSELLPNSPQTPPQKAGAPVTSEYDPSPLPSRWTLCVLVRLKKIRDYRETAAQRRARAQESCCRSEENFQKMMKHSNPPPLPPSPYLPFNPQSGSSNRLIRWRSAGKPGFWSNAL